MTRTIADDCDGDVSGADTERLKFGRVSLHAEVASTGCESRGRHEREGQAQSGRVEIHAEQKMFFAPDFHFLSRHFHSSKLQKPLAFSLAKSTIAFNGRVIFQKERAE
jgi:hypothetical protein